MNAKAHEHAHHVLPLSIYIGVASALIVLTAITVSISFMDFGPYNLVVAMVIAGIKATLVAMFFMHLKYDNKLYTVIFVGSILFLAAFVIFTMFDTLRRDEIYKIKSGPINPNAIIYRGTDTGDTVVTDSLFSDSAGTASQSADH
ncbi:MAG: cytochrome C oxidase subunit IV family protein [Candidatus Zixiibacteriota bacterium]